MTDTDKPEPPVWVGPSATLDIDALLDRMRRRDGKKRKRKPRWKETDGR